MAAVLYDRARLLERVGLLLEGRPRDEMPYDYVEGQYAVRVGISGLCTARPYFDELYDIIFVRPAVRIGAFLWQRGDRDTIDGFGPDGLSGLVVRVSAAASRLQSGFVFHYAFAMLIGVVVLVTWYYLRFGGM